MTSWESNSPSEEMSGFLPKVSLAPNWENTVFWFHDESTFNANDDEITLWKDDTMQVIKPKGRGSGIMVSDFIEERQGYRALSDLIHSAHLEKDATMPQSARVLFEYGQNRDGYWDNNLFMEQMNAALKVAEAKYPKSLPKCVGL